MVNCFQQATASGYPVRTGNPPAPHVGLMQQHSVNSGLPAPQGLYDPRFEHDACGIGFVANIKGNKSHEIIVKGIQVLMNLTHRGACGCDSETGDGAGVLIQIPHAYFARECAELGFTLPPAGEYGVGMTFLPVEPPPANAAKASSKKSSAMKGSPSSAGATRPSKAMPSDASRAVPSPTSNRSSSRAPRE